MSELNLTAVDYQTAKRRLTNRYLEQVEIYPAMRDIVTLKRYIRANIAYTMRHGLLADYQQSDRFLIPQNAPVARGAIAFVSAYLILAFCL